MQTSASRFQPNICLSHRPIVLSSYRPPYIISTAFRSKHLPVNQLRAISKSNLHPKGNGLYRSVKPLHLRRRSIGLWPSRIGRLFVVHAITSLCFSITQCSVIHTITYQCASRVTDRHFQRDAAHYILSFIFLSLHVSIVPFFFNSR